MFASLAELSDGSFSLALSVYLDLCVRYNNDALRTHIYINTHVRV
jgi:hypothetical protein